MFSNDYIQKVYAGFLGMNAGIRLGAPVEPTEWTAEKILSVYGDIKGYVKDYKTFSADDDVNGPVFFIRAHYDDARDRDLQPQDVGRAWLNYCREGIGMIWWGGEDASTEHKAFNNLKKGIEAPRSGSAEQNGIVQAEQIGGQIFIDTWGLMYPGKPEQAAHFAEVAASVSHDKNGLYGARFIAGCIAQAFVSEDIREIIDQGLMLIPDDSTYAQVTKAVINFHGNNPDNFRDCLDFLHRDWGYDKYPGICHIIPNAGVCILSLLYGNGDFARTIEIATMCGWDTDCNAGNVGTIVGVMAGLDGIPEHYRQPMNDNVITSSISGYLNMVDMPTFSKEVALLGYQLNGVEPPSGLEDSIKRGELYFDFSFPGSTHGLRVSNTFKTPVIRHNAVIGDGSLQVVIDRMVEGDKSKVFYKPFYRRDDFNDEKYKPVFSPQALSGQTVKVDVFLDQWRGSEITVAPFVRKTFSKQDAFLEKKILKHGEWTEIEFTLPPSGGDIFDEVGYLIESPSTLTNRAFGSLYFKNFHVYGKAQYSIDFSLLKKEFLSLMPFSHNRGDWEIEGDTIRCRASENCASYTGNYFMRDGIVETVIEPVIGESHCIAFRAQGAERGYFIGLDGAGQVSLILNNFGFTRIKTVSFPWEYEQKYRMKVEFTDNVLRFFIDENEVLVHDDETITYGMIGFGSITPGETLYHSLLVKENI
ncbi:ADP-ribosylglycohydrolase family protein [Bacillus sp. FJAT-27445]|uniref:ADP-ribosylglycohydrolase family protein n=1 Tax=Bacillus sp. FJAT-27445 TaxID=1679166 RepID=UPI000743F577|nr:ADP-ribosylglycohydrolase family protein [Bacillus sp. FJAT-27445]